MLQIVVPSPLMVATCCHRPVSAALSFETALPRTTKRQAKKTVALLIGRPQYPWVLSRAKNFRVGE